MEEAFWRERWREGRLGWHRSRPNPMLVRHLPALELEAGARVFLPLCGKTLDVGWLRDQGFRVVGAELVETAVEQLFQDLGARPAIERAGRLLRYSTEKIDVFVGDLFALDAIALDAVALGAVDAVYDRAALVALPEATRPAYAAHVAAITARAPQLLITYDYDQQEMDGPPFSVTPEEARALYSGAFEMCLLESAEVEGGLKGFCPATERVWSLRAR